MLSCSNSHVYAPCPVQKLLRALQAMLLYILWWWESVPKHIKNSRTEEGLIPSLWFRCVSSSEADFLLDIWRSVLSYTAGLHLILPLCSMKIFNGWFSKENTRCWDLFFNSCSFLSQKGNGQMISASSVLPFKLNVWVFYCFRHLCPFNNVDIPFRQLWVCQVSFNHG